MDEFDRASELEQAQRDAAIARHSVAVAPSWWDGRTCIEPECDEEIPAPRRALGKFRCMDCQQRKESK